MLAFTVLPLCAATYYVSPTGDDGAGDGSLGTPWATMGRADKASLVSGDTVIVQAGTYEQTSAGGVILNTSAGTAASPVTYQAEGKVLIQQQPGLAGGAYGIQVQVSGIVLTGFEVSGANYGIGVSYASDVVISNNVIHDSVSPAIDGDAGIYLLWATNTYVVRNVIYNIHVAGEQPWLIGAALRMASGNNNYFLNNTIDDCFSGFHYYAQDGTHFGHVTTYNNLVANCNGWAFENPWSTDPTLMTNGFNLLYNNGITYGNYPAGNNGPMAGDVSGQEPQFVFRALRDYRLLATSPAIDKGRNVGFPFVGAAPDIGAFEGGYSASTNGTATGKVTANLAGSPAVPNAVVRTLDGEYSTTSDANGNYTLILPAGAISLLASGRGLATQTSSTNLSNGGNVVLNFSLTQTNAPVTYYVDNGVGNDANPGTDAQPWKTIDNGDSKNFLNPGDTVIVRSGTYPQASTNGVYLTNDFGYSFAPITYQAQGGVVIDQSSVSGTSYGFNVAVAGVKIQGFEITGAQHGIYLSPQSSSCTVDSCIIHDANAVGQDAEGIFVDNSSNDTLIRNLIYNITDPSNNPWSPMGCGIRVSYGDNLTVWNNTIDNAFIGIFWYGTELDQYGNDHGPWGHMTVLNNIVVNCPGWAFISPAIQDPSLIHGGFNLVYGNIVDYENFPGANGLPLASDVTEQDPMFVNAGAHNYQLQSGSPAVDAGTYVGLPYQGLGPDLGAFESSYSNSPMTYYVNATTGNNGNPGTAAQPWQTIDNGDAIGVLKPGDTVLVASGSYAQASASGVMLTGRSGSALAPITYKAQGSVVIDQSSFGLDSYGFNVRAVGIVLDGFEVKGAQHGVYLAPGSDSCSVNGCVIHDASASGVNAEGIFVDNSPNVTLTRNVIYNIRDASDAAWSPLGVGIRVSGSDNLKVFNNTIDRCYVGVFYYGGGGLGGGPYGHITTYNNIVVNCDGWGWANPWNTTPSIFTNGYNLTFGNVVSYGNFPAGNNGPGPTDQSADPRFVNAAGGDYHLQAGSPAINSGTDVGLAFAGFAPDLGAYDTLNATPPEVLYAFRDTVQETMVTVVFASVVDVATATNPGNYELNNGNSVSAASLNADGRTVLLTTSPIPNNSMNNILTVDNVQNVDGFGIVGGVDVRVSVPNDVVRLQDSSPNHLLVLEAENYNLGITGGGQAWAFTTNSPFLLPTSTDKNFSGAGCMAVLPDTGSSYSPNPGDMPVGVPELDYRVYFTTTGTNYVWVRGSGNSDSAGNGDSVNLGLDGVASYRINGEWPATNGYSWGSTPTPADASFVVLTAGVHTLNVWMREDGFVLDKLVVSSNPSLNPTGLGPAESAIVPVLAIARSGADIVLTWAGGGMLQSSTNVAGTFNDVAGSSSPWTNAAAGSQMYYRIRQ